MRTILRIIKNVFFGIKTSYVASRKYFAIKCILLMFTTIFPILILWVWKELLNKIIYVKEIRIIACFLIIYVVLKLLIYLIIPLDRYVNKRYSDALWFYIDKVMMDKTGKMDYEYFDLSSMGDKIQRTRNSFDIMTGMTWTTFSLISAAINIVTVVTAIILYKWWIGLITFLFMIPYAWLTSRHSRKVVEIDREQTCNKRKMNYVRDSFNETNFLFEIKANNIANYFIDRFHEAWSSVFASEKRENVKFAMSSLFIDSFGLSGVLVVFAFVTKDVIKGVLGIGDLQYYIELVNRFREQIGELISKMNDIIANDARLEELQEFISLKSEQEKSGKLQLKANPSIEFKDVYFKYPNSTEYVLRGCSFKINKNEKVALIGLNGAGKSTIINLLFRLYAPEAGDILIDDRPIQEYDISTLRRGFSVLFQDYVTYCLPIREILAFSDFDARNDDYRLEKACKKSGADKIISNWENGMDSIVGRYYADGYDLSGGQWQIVGLARAYFAEREYMILDEPSAALDPIEEDRIFNQLYETDEVRNSITISHRLSNTILSDKIFILYDGRITEQGTHDELMQQEGEYKKLFSLQAEKYA